MHTHLVYTACHTSLFAAMQHEASGRASFGHQPEICTLPFTGVYEDLLKAGIIDPTKVVRCALENAASVARTFLTSDVVVTEIPEAEPQGAGAPGGMDAMGGY